MKNDSNNYLVRQYEAMINAFEDGVYIVDIMENGDYRFKIANKKIIDTIGLPQSEIFGKTINEIFDSEISGKLTTYYDQCMKEKKIVEYEDNFFSSNRRSFWKTRLSPLCQDKEIIGILGVAKDITSHKDIKESLILSENRYQTYVENAPYGVFVADYDGNYLEVNQTASQITGYSREELLQMNLKELISHESTDKALQNFKRLKENGVAYSDSQFCHKNGTKRWWTVNAVKLNDTTFLGFTQDINEKKNFELALKNSEQNLEMTLDSIGDAIISTDKKGAIVRMNAIAETLTGWSFKDALGLYYKQVLCFDEGDDTLYNRISEILQGQRKSLKAKNVVITSKDKKQYILKESTTPIIDSDGEISGIVFVLRDVTAETQTHKIIAEKEQLFQAMLHAIPDMVSVQDIAMNIMYSNWNGFAQVPLAKKKLNTKCFRTYRGYNEPCPDCQAKNVIETKATYQSQAQLPDGTWVEIRVIPIFENPAEDENEKKKVKFFLEWVRDITDFKKKEAALQEQKEELNAINEELEGYNEEMKAINEELLDSEEKANKLSKAKSEFLANMSHELRTPLNGILGFSRLIKETEINELQADYLECVIYSGETLLDIISDILDFSKIEAGKLLLEEKDTDIKKMLTKTFNLMKYNKCKNQLRYELKIDEKIPVYVKTDPLRLNQVITNLLSNAVKFTKEGSVILQAELLHLEGTQAKIRFSVKDSGIGISKKQTEHIFEMFTQADSSTTRMYGGTGLGLSIVVSILKKMGSKLYLSSELSKGSTFSFECVFNVHE